MPASLGRFDCLYCTTQRIIIKENVWIRLVIVVGETFTTPKHCKGFFLESLRKISCTRLGGMLNYYGM